MRPQRRHVIGGLTATVLGGGAAGLLLLAPSLSNAAGPVADVVAQAPPTTEPDSSETETTEPATAADSTPAEDTTDDTTVDEGDADVTARSDGLRELLQPLVDDGTLTAEQADAVVAELEGAAIGHQEIWVEGPMVIHGRDEMGMPGMGLPGMGPDIGPDMGFPGGPGFPGHGGPGMPEGSEMSLSIRVPFGSFSPDVIADTIGIELTDLMSQIREGATVADIATASGVDPQTVIDALVDNTSDHLAVAVDEGSLTEEDAAAILADATTRIAEFVNGEEPAAPDAPAAPESGTDETATTAPDETVTDVTETTTSA